MAAATSSSIIPGPADKLCSLFIGGIFTISKNLNMRNPAIARLGLNGKKRYASNIEENSSITTSGGSFREKFSSADDADQNPSTSQIAVMIRCIIGLFFKRRYASNPRRLAAVPGAIGL
ncbi:MAG: hypothetical protein ABID09_07645 [Candidatus Omnitrophota bacterium]